MRIIVQNLFNGGKVMFLQILYAIAKGLLEMDGYQLTSSKQAPAVVTQPDEHTAPCDETKCYK